MRSNFVGESLASLTQIKSQLGSAAQLAIPPAKVISK
jgi:hypothetical protein